MGDAQPEPPLPEPFGERVPRQARIFVSSTFQDMTGERDELVKRTFPELRRRCRSQQVDLVEVDLRWGVTDAQSRAGETLAICLREVRQCRPYFLGLLGERYGSSAREIPPRLLDEEPWLEPFRQRSLTELEILHGVLLDPAMAKRAYFYFRDPAFGAGLPPPACDLYREIPSAAETAQFGAAEAEHRAGERRRSLAALKERIRALGLPLKENCANPKALGAMVLEDLWTAIQADFPMDEHADPLSLETSEHEAFARSRWKFYVGGARLFGQLDAFMDGDEPVLMLTGDHGSGKSALLASWVRQRRARHPRDAIFLHFAGATPGSASYANLLRRLGGDTERRLGLESNLPSRREDLAAALPGWLASRAAAAAREGGRSLIVIDALDQLDAGDDGRELTWLPVYFPPGTKLILSAAGGQAVEAAQRRGWRCVAQLPLDYAERTELVRDYLAQFRKSLSDPQENRIAASPAAANPLYMMTLLNELRISGSHGRLEQQIDGYLRAGDLTALLDMILRRWEEDFNAPGFDLVRRALALVLAARDGLSESELVSLLAPQGESRLPSILWSPLAAALSDYTINRNGVLNFSHPDVRRAAQSRYCPAEEDRRRGHATLADFFARMENCARKASELPFQLQQSGQREILRETLADVEFAAMIAERSAFDLLTYWRAAAPDAEMAAVYRKAAERWDFAAGDEVSKSDAESISKLGRFFSLADLRGLAEAYLRRALDLRLELLARKHPKPGSRSAVEQAKPEDRWLVLARRGVVLEADELDALRDYRELGAILSQRGALREAMQYLVCALVPLHQKLGANHPLTMRTQRAVSAAAIEVAAAAGWSSDADAEHEEKRLRNLFAGTCDRYGLDHPETLEVEVLLASVLTSERQFSEAGRLLRHAVDTAARIYGPRHIKTAEFRIQLAEVLSKSNGS